METFNGLVVWILCFVLSFVGKEISAAPGTHIGSKPLNWTVYTGLGKKTWNEASRFCQERGGHLPATNTDLAIHALKTFLQQWLQVDSFSNDVWIGLYSREPNTVPDVWEADSSINQEGVQDWDNSTSKPEPNELDKEMCVRVTSAERAWRTTRCGIKHGVVCEHVSAGDCPYKSLEGFTMTQTPDVVIGADEVSTCWSYCLALQDGKECVAAVLEMMAPPLCNLYLGQHQLTEHNVTTPVRVPSTTMLRDCFRAQVDNETYNEFEFLDDDIRPKPAGGSNLSAYQPDTTERTQAIKPPASQKRLCPCSCGRRHSKEPKPAHASLLLPRNQSSKHRRSKTSAMVAKTSYTVVGTTWIIASVAMFGFFALCDLKFLNVLGGRLAERRGREVDAAKP